MSSLNTIDRTCTDFNKCVRFLARVYDTKVKSDISYRLQKTLNTVISTDPTVPIKLGGPYIHKYAEPISKHDEKFYMTTDFTEDSKDSDDPNEILQLISSVRDIFKTFNTAEKEKMMTCCSDMLSHYCEYKLATKS